MVMPPGRVAVYAVAIYTIGPSPWGVGVETERLTESAMKRSTKVALIGAPHQ